MDLDVAFDYFDDTPRGKDPDTYSPGLRLAHQFLWSKPLPSGRMLELRQPATGRDYLEYVGVDGSAVTVGSDAFTNSYTSWNHIPALAEAKEGLTTEQRDRFLSPKYTIGQTMIWPVRYKVRTINQARGTINTIDDRADLTLECIRRHYAGEDHPLNTVLMAYADFFELFGTFGGFVEFFFLDDLVDEDGERVRFWEPQTNFATRGAPVTLRDFVAHREATIEFVERREKRIARWVAD